jgi:hypothetical protein
MAGSDEWRCAAATMTPGHSATFRLERAERRSTHSSSITTVSIART